MLMLWKTAWLPVCPDASTIRFSALTGVPPPPAVRCRVIGPTVTLWHRLVRVAEWMADMMTGWLPEAPEICPPNCSNPVPVSLLAVMRYSWPETEMLERLVGGHLTPFVGALAVLLALTLGAAHAALPGHGKTVMAAYIAGRRGRRRDALTVGAIVTLTHTGGVLVLGLLLTATAGLAGEVVLSWLGIASGILVAAVGVAMLAGVLRRRTSVHHHDHGHSHEHPHDHHGHPHPHPSRQVGRLSLVGMGIAGGLVPSPSALIVLLGAVGLGRTAFGVLLVLAYGAGMAAMLTAAGLVLVRIRDRWASRPRRTLARLAALAPTGTAALVLCVGLGLAGRAALGVVH